MSGIFWLTEEQFNKTKPLPPNKPRGVPRADDRKVLSGNRIKDWRSLSLRTF